MACTNLIILFITRELNTDSFQKNRDRIYLLKCDNPLKRGVKCQNAVRAVLNTLRKIFRRLRIFAASDMEGLRK